MRSSESDSSGASHGEGLSRALTDGGEETASPFDVVSDISVSRTERYRHLLDVYLIAPALVLWDDWRARFGIVILLGYTVMGTIGVWMIEVPDKFEGERYLPPFQDLNMILGADNLGAGVFGQIVHATPAMFQMMLAGAVLAISVGTLVGSFAGFKAGTIDSVLMTISDIMIAIPGLPLIVVISALLEPRDPYVVGVVLAVNRWAGLSRRIRSQVLSVREFSYVEAARTMGTPTWRILRKDILPNIMPYIVINFVTTARAIVIASVGLYFIGILPFSTLNWGVMMNQAHGAGALVTPELAHWFISPMVAIVLLVLGLILLGQSADRIFNPRLRARHASDGESAPPEAH